LLTIAVFAMVYFASALVGVGNTAVGGLVDALSVSYGSFVTLIFSTTPQFESRVLQLFAMTEGFLGTLFLALLVFTLTRAVHR
jgi:hypothetical protein